MNATSHARNLLSQAFTADPLMLHAFGPGAGGPARLARLFGPVLEACRLHGGVLSQEEGAAAWLPGALVPLPWGARFRAGFAGLPLSLPPAALLRLLRHEAACETAIQARFAAQRFCYLWVLGVAPASRRQGAGRRLLEATLEAMAGEFELCVLKTENPAAADFYQKMGFTQQDRFVVPASGLGVQILARSVRL